MPIYVWECRECGKREEGFRQVEQRHDSPTCHGRAMGIVILPAAVQGDLPGYQSPTTGRWIEGRAARRDDLARSGARPWEGLAAEKKEAERRKRDAEQKFDRKLDATVRETWNSMSPAKRRILEGGA